MKDLLNLILTNLILDGFSINESEEENRVSFTITVSEDKAGLVIGKQGRIIKAIQDILRIKAVKDGKYVFLKVETPAK